MRYRMLAIDLDGTLLDSEGRVPDVNLAALEKAKAEGLLVVLCTGRGFREARRVIGTTAHEGPVVLAGGALVTDPTTGRTLHRAIIEPGLAAEVVEHLRRLDYAVLVVLDPEPMQCDYLIAGAHNLTENTRWWLHHIGARIQYREEPTAEEMHHALRVGIVAEPEEMPPVQAELVETFGDRVLVQHFAAVKQRDGAELHVLEVFAAGVHKWSGLQWLAREHEVGLDEVAAIGDHINDLSMIEAAGCGIAMGNAVEPVRRAARHVTDSNDEGGVATAIDRILGGQW
jgi:Cof subfamily protein (haloacid dehalogenase superfamily)